MRHETFVIYRDSRVFCGWPDLVRTRDGRLLCFFTVCAAHVDHSHSRIVWCESVDEGVHWSEPHDLTDVAVLSQCGYYYNNAAVRRLRDGRIAVLVDRIYGGDENVDRSRIMMYTSEDDGRTWNGGRETPAQGIVPDKLLETSSGRWLLACHHCSPENGMLEQRLWYSDDRGGTWQGPVLVGRAEGLHLCEASIVEVNGTLVCFMRENSWMGYPAYRTFSRDDGLSWSTPVSFPMPGCHRPQADYLHDGRIFITYRFAQGGRQVTQNLFGCLTSGEGILAPHYNTASARIIPLDYDPAENADTGYSGWVELEDGSLFVVNYLKSDAPNAFIQGIRIGKDALAVHRDNKP